MRDVSRGFAKPQKRLPPKYFYDEHGSRLFDLICDTDEYYLTRSEQALLELAADEIVAPGYRMLVELGSGAARKTRTLLDAVARCGRPCRYAPFDVSESMLRHSARQLLSAYPWLEVHGVVADYERHVDQLPADSRRLVMFLGSTIGNFEAPEAVRFLARIARQLGPNEGLLLGTDLVKDRAVLNAAYNDAAGVTAAFNKNVLNVINRELGGHFDLKAFDHLAYFEPERSQMEIYLQARYTHSVRIDALDREIAFAAGERILTEISRKYTESSVSHMLNAAGLELERWFVSPDGAFALTLARRAN